MTTDVMKMAEVFSEMSVSVLAAHIAETTGPASANEELTRLLSLQRSVIRELKEWEEIKGKYADCLSKAAYVCYANEEVLQTQVDAINCPWEVSMADDGAWCRAWVWVPEAEIQEQMKKLEEKNKPPF